MKEENERMYSKREEVCHISGLKALLVLSPWRLLRYMRLDLYFSNSWHSLWELLFGWDNCEECRDDETRLGGLHLAW